MNSFYTSCKIAKRTQEALGQWADIGGERKRIEFTKEILWLQESESQVLYMHGGKVLKDASINNDFYGYLSSIKGAIEEAEAAASRFGVTQQSSLDVVVQTKVFLDPVMEIKETSEYNRTKKDTRKEQYAYVPNDWRKEVVVEGERQWPALERVELATEIVWSSKHTPEQNAALQETFASKWRITTEHTADMA